MLFQNLTFYAQAVGDYASFLRAFHDYVKSDVSDPRSSHRITWINNSRLAEQAVCGMAQLDISREGADIALRISLQTNAISPTNSSVLSLVDTAGEKFLRIENAARCVKNLMHQKWPGFPRPMFGSTVRQLWLYALDALENKDATQREVFESNTGALLSDILSEDGMLMLRQVLDFMNEVGCLPSECPSSYEEDCDQLTHMAVGIAMICGHNVYQITANEKIKPLVPRKYLRKCFFMIPKRHQLRAMKPFDFYQLALLNPLSFSAPAAPELFEAQLQAQGYTPTHQGLLTVFEHPTQASIVCTQLPNAMCERLQRFSISARQTRKTTTAPETAPSLPAVEQAA